MLGKCSLIRHLRDLDILMQPVAGQAVAPKKSPPEAYFALRASFSRAALISGRMFTIMAEGLRLADGAARPLPCPALPNSAGSQSAVRLIGCGACDPFSAHFCGSLAWCLDSPIPSDRVD